MNVTQNQIINAVKELMQGYGFKCGGGEFSRDKKYYRFDKEKPTGQAAFSQKTTQVQITFWNSENVISVGVRYVHHSHGENGYTEEYEVVPEITSYFNETPEIDLVRSGLLRKIDRYNRRKTKKQSDVEETGSQK